MWKPTFGKHEGQKMDTGLVFGPDGNAFVGGDNFEAAKAGRVVVATSLTAGIALIVAATTGNHPMLWNPSSTGRIMEVLSLRLSVVTGTNAPGGLAWNHVLDTGSTVATGTGSKILTATPVDVQPAMVGGKLDSKLYFAPAINTFTAAPVYGRPISLTLMTGAEANATPPYKMEEVYDKNNPLLIAPGSAICLVSENATTTSTYRFSIVVREHDE